MTRRAHDVLDLRDLNRATLTRQLLLERETSGNVLDVLDAVGGLQAQMPGPPLIGLWSRVAQFDRAMLLDRVHAGEAVRGTTLRGTIHLVSAREYCATRAALQPVLDAFLRTLVPRRVRDEDVQPAIELGKQLLAERPRPIGELKAPLAERFPESEAQALGNVVRMSMPLVMVPSTAAADGWAGNAPFAHAADVLPRDLHIAAAATPNAMIRRFLAACGPGSAKDAQTWSGLRGLAPVMRAMHEMGELITVRTFEDIELYDVPNAPRPSGDVPGGVRFLPRWDNLLLAHADRSRVIDPKHRPYLASKNGMSPPVFLVDGFAAGTWRTADGVLWLAPFAPLRSSDRDALIDEGMRLLDFVEPETTSPRVQIE